MSITIDYWQKKVNGKDLKRKNGTKGFPKESILIVCEGQKTEPNYFEAFRITSVEIFTVGAGAVTESLVREAIKHKEEALKRKNIRFDQVWCVFDKDSNPSQCFNNALSLAKSNNIKVAYSNQAFELWYLLHFELMQSAVPRSEYIRKLSGYLGKKYQKSEDLYEVLISKQKVAIKNAEKLLGFYNPRNPDKDDPSTTVHLLVQALIKFL